MAQLVTRAQTTMKRIGIARGNLAFLCQTESGRMGAILGRFATQYRITENGMTRARSLRQTTVEDCALAVIRSLNSLTRDASFIRGFIPLDARRVNPHLRVLAAECRAFTSAQSVNADLDGARRRFLECDLGSGHFAGSALPPGVTPTSWE
jgi:hypothetical protein